MRDFRDELHDVELLDAPTNGDEDRQARVDAALRLLETGPGPGERSLAIERLSRLKAAHHQVRSAARSKSLRIRVAAAAGLGWYSDPVDRRLLLALSSDPSAPVRRSACQSLGIGGYHDVFNHLLAVAEDHSEQRAVRDAAMVSACRAASEAEELAVAYDAASSLFNDGAVAEQPYAAALGALTGDNRAADRLRILTEQAMSRPTDERLARQLITSLARHEMTDESLRLVGRALDELPGARSRACAILSQHPRAETRPSLERLLSDPSPKLAGMAVQALAALGGIGTNHAVRSLLRQDSPASRHAVGMLGGEGAVPLLTELVDAGPLGIRPAALTRLAELDAQSANAAAGRNVDDRNPKLRVECYVVLVMKDQTDHWIGIADADRPEWIGSEVRARLRLPQRTDALDAES